MFHTSHMYTQFTSCSITCIVAESCHEEHGQRKDDTQSKQAFHVQKARCGSGALRPRWPGFLHGVLDLCLWGVSWWFGSTDFWHFTTGFPLAHFVIW